MYSPSEINFDLYDEPRLHMECLLNTHLIDFDLSLRILLPLETAGITRLKHLVAQNRETLLQIRQLGKISVDKLEAFLHYHGFTFKGE